MNQFEITENDEELKIKGLDSELRIMTTGCNMYKLVISGKEILQAPVDFTLPVGAYGMPVMFPYANRIRNASFEFNGTKYTMIKHGKPVLMHGLVGDEKFEIIEKFANTDSAYVVYRFVNSYECENYRIFPFLCSLTLKFILEEDAFNLVWEVCNNDNKYLPFGFGVHTFFRKNNNPDRIVIHVPEAVLMETDNYYPTGNMIWSCDKETSISTERVLDELELDTLYRINSFPSFATIKYLDENINVSLECSENMKYMMVFTPHSLTNAFCLENQTNATYGYNLYEEGKKDESGIIVLKPGEIENGWIKIKLNEVHEA